MNLKPLGDRVIVRTVDQEDVTASGIVLPDTAQEKPQRGVVLAVGDGRVVDGERIPLDVSDGDEVIYSKYGGTEVRLDGEDVLILSEHDILARVAASAEGARQAGRLAQAGRQEGDGQEEVGAPGAPSASCRPKETRQRWQSCSSSTRTPAARSSAGSTPWPTPSR